LRYLNRRREAGNMEVALDSTVVTLRGKVDAWTEGAAAYGVAWSAPSGVPEVAAANGRAYTLGILASLTR
jgi:osmotically-inducible protein OsmY